MADINWSKQTDTKKIQSLTASLNKMTEQSNTLATKNTQLETENESNKALIAQLRADIAGLKGLMSTSSQTVSSETVELKRIKYKGAAKIIPVFGSGSHGITTTAMSVASKLSGSTRVVYLD